MLTYSNKVVGAGVLPRAEYKILCALVAWRYEWTRYTVHLTY